MKYSIALTSWLVTDSISLILAILVSLNESLNLSSLLIVVLLMDLNRFGLLTQMKISQSISMIYLIFTKAPSEKFARVCSILAEYLLSKGDMLLKFLFLIYFILFYSFISYC